MNWRRGLFRVWFVLSVVWLLYQGWTNSVLFALSAHVNHYPTRVEFQKQLDAWNSYPESHLTNQSDAIDAVMGHDNPYVALMAPQAQKGSRAHVAHVAPQDHTPPMPMTPPIFLDQANRQIVRFLMLGIGLPIGLPPALAAIGLLLFGIGKWIAAGFKISN